MGVCRRNGGRALKRAMAITITVSAIAVNYCAGVQRAYSQEPLGLSETGEQKLELTAAQRRAIYDVVSKDNSKKAPVGFPTAVGADVPPMIELYALPDDAVANNAAAKIYKYTVVQDKVVLVDPTKMRVIDIIGPTQR